jgi:hypothetical protein
MSDRILIVEKFDKWINIEVSQSPAFSQSRLLVSHIKFIIHQPDVRLDSGAAGLNRRKEWNFAPVVVVGMTCSGYNVPRRIRRPTI